MFDVVRNSMFDRSKSVIVLQQVASYRVPRSVYGRHKPSLLINPEYHVVLGRGNGYWWGRERE